MNEFEKIRAWNALKNELSKIHDYKTRVVYYKALLARACAKWGFNPEKPGQPIQNESAELDDWEKEFVEDINDTIVFGIDVRKEKRQQTYQETKARMLQFIERGGCLLDIPDNIRKDTIEKLYYDCLLEYGDKLLEQVDLITKGKNNDGQSKI